MPWDSRSVRLISTGGTIASQPAQGGVVAARSGEQRLSAAGVGDVRCTTHELLRIGSYRFSESDLRAVAAAAVDAAQEENVDGVVVTHGTDTTEESAFLADLVHSGMRPVVFCGAQRNASEPDGDGARNPWDAVRLAADPHARGLGVTICMAGHAWPARPVYGGPGAGAQLAEAGAIFAGRLRPPHARLLLAAALSVAEEPDDVASVFAQFT
jgi:L-asparaginase